MKSPVLENLRECCHNPKSNLIIFDGADTADLPILVCKKCEGKPIFQKFVVSKFKIIKQTNIEQILINFSRD
ncbi:MAG: hypothetical protein OEY17_07960 [Nitrosopumilus sp.]|nr:hypothetical protein [Nitrosopumilus sp.]MDH5659260.1 hypothetical protein [Nitrosopumilus sp.]